MIKSCDSQTELTWLWLCVEYISSVYLTHQEGSKGWLQWLRWSCLEECLARNVAPIKIFLPFIPVTIWNHWKWNHWNLQTRPIDKYQWYVFTIKQVLFLSVIKCYILIIINEFPVLIFKYISQVRIKNFNDCLTLLNLWNQIVAKATWIDKS